MFDFDPYIKDIQDAGAEVIKTTPGDSGPFINVKYHGTWPVLEKELEQGYILLDQFGGPFEEFRMVIRPVEGIEGIAFDSEEKDVVGDIEGQQEIPEEYVNDLSEK